MKNTNYYETSILEERLENINKKELLKENIENYKNKLLSSYWTEINLIGYKIELLEKQKFEYPKELKNRIIILGNEIRGVIEGDKRKCFNCSATIIKNWYIYLKEHYLCDPCNKYKIYNGRMRPEGSFYQTNMEHYFCPMWEMETNTKMKQRITKDRKCFTCGATRTSIWCRHSIPKQYICNACYQKQLRIKNKTNKNKTEQESKQKQMSRKATIRI
uniref:GATA-type domain-containing protein n=2 Tax=Meloidogyne TaxID=189290 RepID=A0A6V7UPJ1_MELEN|nr:unnamed protein product [Meloidogyne enterolobii]